MKYFNIFLGLLIQVSCEDRTIVNSMIFQQENEKYVASLKFNNSIIIENIFLAEKINEDLSRDVQSLNKRIIYPENYTEKAKMAMKRRHRGSQLYEDAHTNEVTIDMTNAQIIQERTYAFKIKPFMKDNEIYTGTFIYADGKILHSEEKQSTPWYSNPWVWSSIALILLVVLLLAKAICY